ncbi:VQ motif-containing protein 9-like protein [Cinnamomum micranthum f. kanehirae]|uniref:VQ motif-containing protein 9-like protein n=1 Tax=Cinnamomum micranthum f. kanehirae TaxID=337451 RepID=A0A3S3QDD4_9MAGN|nr:VQ motif-containing protein 9-like protein [Cinnamomum micranthum f. kanehirae]
MDSDHQFSSPLRAFDREEKSLSLLHGVRRPPSKPWKKPASAAAASASASSMTRVYVVDPHDFRSLVQKLTGAPEATLRRLQVVAPPPLNIAPPLPSLPKLEHSSNSQQQYSTTTSSSVLSSPTSVGPCSMGFLSPPSYFSLCSSLPLLSPGTMASFEQNTVL